MLKEDYCSYEVAKLLKEKGFNYKGFDYIDFEGEVIKQDRQTHQMAMKWLRSNQFEVIVQSETDYDEDERGTKYYHTPIWYFTVYRIYDSNQMSDDARYFATFEGASEAGIKYCLENLI